jgi:hypothetical protein
MSPKNDAETGDTSPASPITINQTLRVMKLTTEEEMSMFRRVRAWMEGRSVSVSYIKVDPLVLAAVVSRLLLTSCTTEDVDPTQANNIATTQEQEQENTTPGTPSDTNTPSSVTPDEAFVAMDLDDAKEVAVSVVVGGKPEEHASASASSQGNAEGISTNPTQSPEKLATLKGQHRYIYLSAIATDLATLLAAKEKQNGSPSPNTSSTPTVAYIASAYLSLFKNKDDETPSTHASDLYKTVIDKEASTADILKAATFLQKSLLFLNRSAKFSVETYSDFEYLWSSCAGDAPFRASIMKSGENDDETPSEHNENGKGTAASSEEVFSSMKHCCWKLSCLGANFNTKKTRRGRIVTSAACLGILACLPLLEDKNEQEPPTKKARTMEDDAIAALSMMVKEKYSVEPTRVSVASANALISSLRGAGIACAFISADELDKVVVALVKNLLGTEKEVQESTDKRKKPSAESGDEKESFVVSELKSLLPTKADRKRLIDMATIDEKLTAQDKQAIQDATESFDGFPFSDEPSLVSSEKNLVPLLCMASSKASSSGVALTFEYDGKAIMKSQEGQAAAAMTALMAGTSTGSPPDRSTREVMELNEWTVSVLSLSDVRPSTRLMLYLKASDDECAKQKRKRPDESIDVLTLRGGWRSVIVPLLNRVIGRMIEGTPNPEEDATANSRLSVLEESGAVVVHGDDDDVEIKLCQALIALYYQSLESLLYHETARVKSASHPKLLLCESFHRAMLSCCCICLMKGLCSSSALALSEKYLDLDFPCIQHITESCPYTYLKVSESFARALKLDKPRGKLRTPYVLGLPRILQQQLSQCEVLVIDSLLWSQDTRYAMDISVMDVVRDIKSIPDRKLTVPAWPPEVLQPNLPEEIDDCKDKAEWANRKAPALKLSGATPPDHLYLSYIIRKLLKIAFFRISAFCNALAIPPEYPVASQVWIAFRYLLRHHFELLYDRHVDQLILCTLYGVCKIMKFEPELTFSRIIEIYTQVRGDELGDRTCHRIVRHIKLIPHTGSRSYTSSAGRPKDARSKKKYGNVIHLYNDIFVPAMKNHLLQSKSLKKSIVTLHVQMAQGTRRNRSVKENEIMAARAEKLAHDSGNWANPEPTSIPVREGNVKMNILLQESNDSTSDGIHGANAKRKSRAKLATSFAFNPENRSLFRFGDASGGVSEKAAIVFELYWN